MAIGTSTRDRITGMLLTADDSFMLDGAGGFIVLQAIALEAKIIKNKKRFIISLKQQFVFEGCYPLWF